MNAIFIKEDSEEDIVQNDSRHNLLPERETLFSTLLDLSYAGGRGRDVLLLLYGLLSDHSQVKLLPDKDCIGLELKESIDVNIFTKKSRTDEEKLDTSNPITLSCTCKCASQGNYPLNKRWISQKYHL